HGSVPPAETHEAHNHAAPRHNDNEIDRKPDQPSCDRNGPEPHPCGYGTTDVVAHEQTSSSSEGSRTSSARGACGAHKYAEENDMSAYHHRCAGCFSQ